MNAGALKWSAPADGENRMARLEKADRRQLPPEFEEKFDIIEKSNGYVPNSYLMLAPRPRRAATKARSTAAFVS